MAEEMLMAIMLYSDGMTEGSIKAQALIAVVKSGLVGSVTKDRQIENILSSMNLLRLLALIHSPENSAHAVPVFQALNELLVFS